MKNQELIEKMDTGLVGLIVMFLQLFIDTFRDELEDDSGTQDAVADYLDNIIAVYCELLDDPEHAVVVYQKVDDVTDTWAKIKEGFESTDDTVS